MKIRVLALICLAAVPVTWGQKPVKPEGPLPDGLYAIFNTGKGTITAQLFEKYTPISVKNFVGLATGTKAWREPVTHNWVHRPMYDNITFHRVLKSLMIQSGDPTGTTAHDCGFTIPDEFLLGIQFDHPGKLAVANTGAADSGACQIFITDDLIPQWNNRYTIFGQVVRGMAVVDAIAHAPVHEDKPVTPVKLMSVTIERIGPVPTPKIKKK